MTWNQYVSRHLVGRTQTSLAADVGVSNTAISRWLKGSQGVDAGVAIRFARAVGDDPLTALIEAGYLTPDEAGAAPALPADTSGLSFDDLLDLVRERYEEALDPAAMAEVLHRFGRRAEEQGATVHQLRPAGATGNPLADLTPEQIEELVRESAARNLGEPSAGERLRAEQDEAGEAGDPETEEE